MARRSKHTQTIVLATLTLIAAAAAFWSRRQVPDSVREERQNKVLPTLRRERISRIEIDGPTGRFELRKDNGRWSLVANGRRHDADDTQVEQMLTEAEFATVVRRLGSLERAARERFGLLSPRARVRLYEDTIPTATFAIGGLVAEEQNAYVEVEGKGAVAPRSFADAFVTTPAELRDRTLSQVEPSRLLRLELEGEGGRRVLSRVGALWRLSEPAEGRVSRARAEAIVGDVRDMRATRWLTDGSDPATLARHGLAQPRLVVRAIRDRGAATIEWRFGGPCEGREDEITVNRTGLEGIACVGHAVFENLARNAQDLRDDKLLWTRANEVERIRVHSPSGEFTVERIEGGGTWRLQGASGEADGDAVEAWVTALGQLSAEARLEGTTAALHGLGPPATFWIEISRTGVEGTERINVGEVDADHVYASRDDEPIVLAFDPAAVETLRVDPVRFRARRVVRDVPDELVSLITEAPGIHDHAQRIEGTWRLVQPFAHLADPPSVRNAANRLASLDAERWVASAPQPAHGLDTPRLRVTARFEGEGPEPEGDAGRGDAGRPRLREYTLNIGAPAPGGAYAMLAGRPGVFVLSQAAFDDLAQAHVDRNVLESNRTTVERVEITRPGPNGRPERIAVRRDGNVWRTDAGQPADRTRVNALLERLELVRAPRVFGYGAPPPEAQLGTMTLSVTMPAPPGPDAGSRPPQVVRLVLGASFGVGDEAGVYARREGIDATLSVPRAVADAIREFRP